MSLSLTSLIGTDGKPKVRVSALLLAVLSFGIYAGTIGHGYNMDDVLVTQGHHLTSKGFSAIGQIFTSPYYEDDMGYNYEYRPITHVSFAIEHGLFGERAGVSHLINVLLHSVTVLLVFIVSRLMFPLGNLMFPLGNLLFPLLAALLFAVHPMHTEAVANIKNRDELLALLFALLSLFYAIRALDGGNVANWLLIPLFLALSLFSKASGAGFLLLVPMCAPLRPVLDFRKLGLLLAAVSIPMGAFMFLKGFLLHSFITAGLLLTVPFLIIVLWRFVKRMGWDRILDFLRPAGWPTTASGQQPVVSRLRMSDMPIVVTATAAGAIGFLYHQPVLLAIVMCILLVWPFWSGRYRLSLLLLSAAMLILLSFMTPVNGSAFLVLFYMATVFHLTAGTFDRKQFVAVAMITVIALVTSEYRRYPQSWEGPMISTLISVGPLLAPVVLTYMVRDKGKKLLRIVWGASCLITMSDFVLGMGVNEFLLFCGNLFGLMYFNFKWPVWLPDPRHIICLLIIIGTAVVVSPGTFSFKAPIHEQEGVAEESMTVAAHDISGSENINTTALDDRPLTFVEYPLIDRTEGFVRIGTASAVLGHYLKMMFIPWPQAFYYGYDEVRVVGLKDGVAVTPAVLHILLLLLALYFARSHPLLSFGIVAYLASIFLFSNLISPVAGMMGDRLTYVASFGFCISLAYVLTMLYQRFNSPMARKVFAVALGALLVTWSGMTVVRSAQWKDALTLMRHDIRTVPNSAQAHNLLASHLMMNSFEPKYAREAMDMRLEAIGHFKQSVRIWPEFFNVWYDIGRAYMTINQPDNALPAYKEAHRLDSTFYDATLNVAVISEQRGNLAQAVKYYERCIRFNPEMPEPYGNLSYLHFREGRYEESIAVNERAITQNPAWTDSYLNIAKTYETMGMPDKAAEYRSRANRQR